MIPADSSKNFNSQPHEEADNSAQAATQISGIHFNSQPHEEADSVQLFFSGASGYFNSQPHEEADVLDGSWRNG